jgi:hypothetical protein
MRILCAWCEQEGAPAELGEREPLADPTKTHGICRRHWRELVGTLPSRSFPGVELLLVVPATKTRLYRRLRRAVAGVSGVKVILDRRRRERRAADGPVPQERRRFDRRVRVGEPHRLGFIAVRLGRSSSSPGDASAR